MVHQSTTIEGRRWETKRTWRRLWAVWRQRCVAKVRWRRGEAESAVCPLCGALCESAWHMRMECTHVEMVKERRRLVSEMQERVVQRMQRAGVGIEMATA